MHVDPAFTVGEREMLEDAATRWNAVSLDRIVLTDAPAIGQIARRSPTKPGWYAQTETRDGQAYVEISPNLSKEFFHHVAAHEFGHVLHLIYATPGVMDCDGIESTLKFSAEDLAECRRVGACADDSENSFRLNL